MPLNKKGKKIKKAMQKQYGKKKGEKVFYAMESSGKLKKLLKLEVVMLQDPMLRQEDLLVERILQEEWIEVQ